MGAAAKPLPSRTARARVVIMACALVTLITTPASAATSGSRLWVHRDNGGGAAVGSAIVSSPDGADVFVAGEITSSDGQDFLTEADSASTGRQLWVRRYAGPSGGNDAANAIAVSPNGSAVFVTGLSAGANGALDVLTIAYAADTGDRLWSQRYRAPGTNGSQAVALSVSPDGSELFATGSVTRRGRYPDYLTIAYDVPTGSVRWLRRYQGTGHGDDDATAIVAGPGGRTVFVTGESQGPVNFDFATVAYGTSGGHTRWVRRYDDPGHAYDDATAIGVDPHGSTVFVTGNGGAATARAGIETIGYRTVDGATVWRSRYHGPFGAEGALLPCPRTATRCSSRASKVPVRPSHALATNRGAGMRRPWRTTRRADLACGFDGSTTEAMTCCPHWPWRLTDRRCSRRERVIQAPI